MYRNFMYIYKILLQVLSKGTFLYKQKQRVTEISRDTIPKLAPCVKLKKTTQLSIQGVDQFDVHVYFAEFYGELLVRLIFH